MKVRYLTTVTSPLWQAGKAGEIRDLPQRTADILLERGYVEVVSQEKTKKGKANGKGTDKGRDTENERPED